MDLISAFFRSPGPGGIVVVLVIVLASSTYFYLTRWILKGGEDEDD